MISVDHANTSRRENGSGSSIDAIKRVLRCSLRFHAAWLVFALSIASIASAETPVGLLNETVIRIEADLDARVGIVLHDTASHWNWMHRAEERFPMNSTVKVIVCAAVLSEAESGTLNLNEELPIRRSDLVRYSPKTEPMVGGTMSIGDLCLSALDMSDNTAANLLIDRLGGPPAITAFLRQIGDPVSRLDRREPELNTFVPGDPRDTTTPEAFTATMQEVLLGNALAPSSRAHLFGWMSHGSVTGALLRDNAPVRWIIADKSGGGDNTRSIVALVTPPEQAPWIVAIFLSDADVAFTARDAAVRELSAAVMALIRAQ